MPCMSKRPLHQNGTNLCLVITISLSNCTRQPVTDRCKNTHRWKRIEICNPSVPSTSKSVPEHRSCASLSETASPSTLPEIQQHRHWNGCQISVWPRQNTGRITPSSLLNSLYFKTRIIQYRCPSTGARSHRLVALAPNETAAWLRKAHISKYRRTDFPSTIFRKKHITGNLFKMPARLCFQHLHPVSMGEAIEAAKRHPDTILHHLAYQLGTLSVASNVPLKSRTHSCDLRIYEISILAQGEPPLTFPQPLILAFL